MTQLLERVFAKVSRLPEEQDAVAQRLLEELALKERWNKLFEDSQDTLAIFADEALVEHRAGKTKCLN